MDGNVLSGFDSFKLYDTYGFPVDLTQMLCEQHNLTVDLDGFNKLLEEQKERSRKNLKEEKKLQ
jgi:alanyl-tRNA synthetase